MVMKSGTRNAFNHAIKIVSFEIEDRLDGYNKRLQKRRQNDKKLLL